ncbi:MAG TPA: hypothetical protein PKV00_08485, partial [Thauera sp.]|nr:hypothetical protein [Thauera sp.]
GSGLAFLAGGLGGLLITAPLMMLALLSAECRQPRASGGLLAGLCLMLAVSGAWPLALHLNAPELLNLWLGAEWLRLSAAALAVAETPRLLELVGWFLWPLWPVALWGLWRARRHLTSLPALLPVLSLALGLGWVVLSGDLSQANMLALIPGAALLAAVGVVQLRRGAASAFDWFALMSLAVFGILVWLAWSAQAFEWPPGLARHVERNAPDFVLPQEQYRLIAGVAITALWILLVARLPRSISRAPANWAIGLVMLWSLAVVLLMPWFDHGRSYRGVVQSLDIAVQGERSERPLSCIATTGLSDAMRTSMDYYAGLRAERIVAGSTPCPLLLVQLERREGAVELAPEWETVWEFRRGAGKRQENFRLLRRRE